MKDRAIIGILIILVIAVAFMNTGNAVDINMLRGCTDGQVAKWDNTNSIWDCANDNAGGGSAIILDLADDASNESTDLQEIATTGDTNSVFTFSSPGGVDKLLIAAGNDWPKADQADALATNPAACSAGQYVKDIDADGTLTCDTPAGGSASNSFETHDVPSGTDPVADSDTDTLTWTVTGSEITLTGNATTDTIDIDFAAHAGTDVTADLEEETHASEHAQSAADALNVEDLDTACAADLFFQEDGAGGVACTVLTASDISDLNGGTDITADLEEEAHCSEHDGRSTTCSTEVLNADAELYTDTKCIWFEDPAAADDFKSIWVANIAATITGISCECEYGDTNENVVFDLQIDDGTPAGVNGSDITCTTWAEDTTLAGDTTIGANERIDLAITSAANAPEWVSICWEFTYDD